MTTAQSDLMANARKYSDTLDIRVTDSSLRDGSHHKRHQFTEDEVRSIVGALDDAVVCWVLDFVAQGAQLVGHGIEGRVVEVGDSGHGSGHVDAVGALGLEGYTWQQERPDAVNCSINRCLDE